VTTAIVKIETVIAAATTAAATTATVEIVGAVMAEINAVLASFMPPEPYPATKHFLIS